MKGNSFICVLDDFSPLVFVFTIDVDAVGFVDEEGVAVTVFA